MQIELERVYERLRAWCRERGYAGHDPFDALNSRVFQATPLLRRSRAARLAWTQLFKRSPVDLRALARVPAGKNAKGTALFALAALARFRAGAGAEHEAEARELLEDLLTARLEASGPDGNRAAWGYNFDWQGRAFYAPRGTPAVVPTAFAVRALVEAARAFEGGKSAGSEPGRHLSAGVERGQSVSAGVERGQYLGAARGACEFILRGLNRSVESDDELCFSYTPLDRTRVFNASLLAAEALASVGALTGEKELKGAAQSATRYVLRRQRADGSWAYGADAYQSWADNFHTAFVLDSLARIQRDSAGELENDADLNVEISRAVERGYAFWRSAFFLADGWPKYYHDRVYPADAHSAGAAIVALAALRDSAEGALELAGTVTRWAVRELLDERGFFHYQRRRFRRVRTPYMRWSQAWMMYALARLLEVSSEQ
ncbi:MAG: hypothetical protein LC802_14215 [Acidobacteria bacterium]|nr:hypothetical protein [Acidobacteriota bacterium]